MKLSMKELRQLSMWSFSASGFSKGTAQAHAESIIWTELYRQSGFTTLYSLLDDVPEFDREKMSIEYQKPMGIVIKHNNQPCILLQNQLLNMSCSDADSYGVGISYSNVSANDESLPTLGHAAYKAAKRGYDSILCYYDNDGNSSTILATPDQPQPLLGEINTSIPPVIYNTIINVIRSELDIKKNHLLRQSFFNNVNDNSQLIDRLAKAATEPSQKFSSSLNSGLVIVCIDSNHSLHSKSSQKAIERTINSKAEDFTKIFQPQCIQERVETMMVEGIEVDRKVWEEILSFTRGRYAPSFEGSMAQAGSGLGE